VDVEVVGRPVAAKPRGAEAGLARDSSRHATTTSTPSLPAAATPRGAVTGLAHESGRRAPASYAETGARELASRRHTSRSRYRIRPRKWEARTGKITCRDREGRRSPPHYAEPLPDSPALVGGAHHDQPYARSQPATAAGQDALGPPETKGRKSAVVVDVVLTPVVEH